MIMSRPRKVKFQTSVDESDQNDAIRVFLLFESGQSGHLTINQFKLAVGKFYNLETAHMPS